MLRVIAHGCFVLNHHIFFSAGKNCTSPWKDCEELCCLFFDNVRTNWIAAHVFCLEQGGHLANSTELVGNQISLENTRKHSSCWIATREVFASLNPLDGWHWINGSPFDYRTSWSAGTLKNTGQVGPRCAALSGRSSWEVLNCSKPYFFICKMNKTEENYQVSNVYVKYELFSIYSVGH